MLYMAKGFFANKNKGGFGEKMSAILKKKVLKSALPLAIVFLAAGLFSLGYGIKDLTESRQEPAEMDTLDFSEGVGALKDTYVHTTLYGLYDCYEEETKDGSVTARWYFMDADGEYYSFMAVKVSGKDDLGKADTLLDYSMDYLEEEIGWEELQKYSMNVNGYLRELAGEDLSYYNHYLEDLDAEVKETFLPICLEVADDNEAVSNFMGMLIAAVIFLAVGLIILLPALSATKQVKQYMAGMGGMEVAEMRLESFYTGTPDYKGCHVNSDYILLKKGYKYFLGDSGKVVWAYMHQQNTKYMGIFTVSKAYSVMACMEDGKTVMSQMKNEAMAKEFLGQIASFCPKAVIGYSDELEKLYRKDRAAFLNLKYYKEETVE